MIRSITIYLSLLAVPLVPKCLAASMATAFCVTSSDIETVTPIASCSSNVGGTYSAVAYYNEPLKSDFEVYASASSNPG